jgi:hypothetical protein
LEANLEGEHGVSLYLSVKLDESLLPTPIYANREGGHALV